MFKFATRVLENPALKTVVTVGRFGCVVYCLKTYVCEITMCLGPSMLPTFQIDGDIILLDKLSPFFKPFQRGEVVISTSPTNPRQTICKRIIAMEGQTVQVLARFDQARNRTITIPEGHVWIEGDNPMNSTDSRHYGPVPLAMLKGRVFMKVFYPFLLLSALRLLISMSIFL